MRRRVFYGVAGILLTALATAASMMGRRDLSAIPPVATAALRPALPESMYLVAAPGRVEPLSEEVDIGTEIRGRVQAILVQEGDHVQGGQLLAVLENSLYKAQVAAAAARLRQAQAELRRLLNGARQEERREAWAAVEQAEAVLRNTELELERRQRLFRRGYIAREEADRAERDLRVARARFQETRARHAFITAAAREEDQARAHAAVALAHAQVSEAQAGLDKTFIRAPFTGTVLRKRINPGEIASPETPKTVMFTLADTTTLRVRVDVDEADISKLQLGLQAYVTAATYGNTKFWGRVVCIGHILGKKNIRTDEPVERMDTKILETIITLDNSQMLLPGLRVDAFIMR